MTKETIVVGLQVFKHLLELLCSRKREREMQQKGHSSVMGGNRKRKRVESLVFAADNISDRAKN